ncbi:MAG: cupin domain-containing protein [Armatimonadetes bacterium]|nr:cupin domain-containing protein [Armatimonadota bacterium]
MKPVRIKETCQFRSDKFLPELLSGSSAARVFTLCLRPGQGLAPRSDSEEALCFLVEGSGTIHLDDAIFPMAAGDFAVASAGTVRGFEANTQCVALWIQIGHRDETDA